MLNTNSWSEDEQLSGFLETPLMRLCAHYLYNEKRRSYALDGVGWLLFRTMSFKAISTFLKELLCFTSLMFS